MWQTSGPMSSHISKAFWRRSGARHWPFYRSFGSKGEDEEVVELSERERERLKAFGYLQ